ncbi:esterase/lipase family protein [Gordonia terrae]
MDTIRETLSTADRFAKARRFQKVETRVIGAVLAVLVGLSAGVGNSTAEPTRYPVDYNGLGAYTAGMLRPDTPPAGANDPSCRSREHPHPVILVHGTGLNQNANWQAIAPELANRGYCVFTLTVGRMPYSVGSGAIGPVRASAANSLPSSNVSAHGRALPRWTSSGIHRAAPSSSPIWSTSAELRRCTESWGSAARTPACCPPTA